MTGILSWANFWQIFSWCCLPWYQRCCIIFRSQRWEIHLVTLILRVLSDPILGLLFWRQFFVQSVSSPRVLRLTRSWLLFLPRFYVFLPIWVLIQYRRWRYGLTHSLFIKQLGILYHYDSMRKGLLDTRDVIYFLSVIFLMLSITKLILSSRQW